MINKRLLIKNLLAHNDECSFYDKKRQLNLHSREGKAKFLKHICALSNSNPTNNSYIVVGVEDHDNEVLSQSVNGNTQSRGKQNGVGHRTAHFFAQRR